jgi:hypothetical protein
VYPGYHYPLGEIAAVGIFDPQAINAIGEPDMAFGKDIPVKQLIRRSLIMEMPCSDPSALKVPKGGC